jgi:hypothetical protein
MVVAMYSEIVIISRLSTTPNALKSPMRISPKTIPPTGTARQAQNERKRKTSVYEIKRNGPSSSSSPPRENEGRSSANIICSPWRDMMRMNTIMS